MPHRGPQRWRLRKTAGYRWYDRNTGLVDLIALARDAVTGPPLDAPAEVPAWVERFSVLLENAKPSTSRRVDALARAAALRAMGGG